MSHSSHNIGILTYSHTPRIARYEVHYDPQKSQTARRVNDNCDDDDDNNNDNNNDGKMIIIIWWW